VYSNETFVRVLPNLFAILAISSILDYSIKYC
jgi:hypothetical protein